MPKIDPTTHTTPTTPHRSMVKCAGDWQGRASTQLDTCRGYISKEAIARLEQGVAARVHVNEFRPWLAKEMKRRHLQAAAGAKNPMRALKDKRCKATAQLATATARDTTQGMGSTHAGEATMNRMVDRVRRWILKRTSQSVGTPHLTPPMIHTMTHGMNSRGTTARDVEAALIILVAQKEVTAQWRAQGEGRAVRDPLTQSSEWMIMNAWMPTPKVRSVVAQARKGVTLFMTGTPVIFDVCEGYGGAKEGLSRVAVTYGLDSERQMKGAKEGRSVPDMLVNTKRGGDDLVQYMRTEALVRATENVGMHASPNCKPHTIIQRLENARTGSAAMTEAEAAKQRAARRAAQAEEKEVVAGLVASIRTELARNPSFAFTVEQPKGSALINNRDMKKLGAPVEVRMCAYGYRWCKPTWIWSNLYPQYWRPRDWMVHCTYCKTNTMHPVRIVRRNNQDTRPQPKIPGFSVEASKNRIHPALAEELGRAMMSRWREGAR